MKRRQFTKGMFGLPGLGLASGLYTWQVEPFWLEFVKKKMPVRNLPDHLEGSTLMQISDIHVGNRFDWKYIVQSFKMAQKLNPDFVVYTGDYVSYESDQQIDQLHEVLKNVVRGKIGTIGILGNHDYGRNWSQSEVAGTIADVLKHSGIEVLRNEQKETDGLNFIGLDDYWATNFQPQKVMSNYNKGISNVLLCWASFVASPM